MSQKNKILVTILLFFVVLVVSDYFTRITAVDCQIIDQEQQQACPEQLTAALKETLLHQPLLYQPLKQKISTAKTIFGHYLILKLRKKWPNQLQLILQKDRLVYQVDNQQKIFSLTRSGVIDRVAKTDPQLPQIKTDLVHLQSSQLIDDALHQKILRLIQFAQSKNMRLVSVDLDQGRVKAKVLFQPRTIVLMNFNQKLPLRELALILQANQYQTQLRSGAIIDLRFRLPILRKHE